MNNRFKELWEQSKTSGVHPKFGEYDKYSPEKFAQLIIAECVQVAHPKLTDVGEWAAGMRLVQKRLKEHFGVKE